MSHCLHFCPRAGNCGRRPDPAVSEFRPLRRFALNVHSGRVLASVLADAEVLRAVRLGRGVIAIKPRIEGLEEA